MKRSLILLITLTAVLLLTACNAAAPSPTAPTTTAPTVDTTTATTVETTVPTTTTTTPTEASTATVIFSTDVAYFSLDLPREWIGHYAVRETEDTVTFFELQNHQQNGQGKLFSIRFIPEDAYHEDMYPSYRELSRFDGFTVVAVFPTDVQFDMELMEPYTAMQAQIDDILTTFCRTEAPANG